MNEYAASTSMKLDMRFGGFGVRHACVIGKDTSVFEKGDTLDLVRFCEDGNTHYVIGCWRAGSEGYVFESIGNRLFEDIDSYEAEKLWPCLRSIQAFLDGMFYD